MGTSQAYRVAISFVSNILLIRLLAPSDFGLVGMVALCVSFITMLQNLGLNQATIQREHISQAQMSALFWLSVGLSTMFAALFAASAPLVAMFFGESRLLGLTWAFAGLVFLSGLQMQQMAYLNRHLRFRTIAMIDVLSVTANAAAGVTIAWLTGSYWALFASVLASTLVTLAGAWTLSGWQPGRPSFEGAFKEIFQFGSGVSGFNLVNYFARNADNLLIGRFYGAEPLGYYDRAYKLLLFPIRQLSMPLGRVMLPLLSRLKNEPERYRNAYAECLSLMMMAAHPGILFLVVFADDVFLLLFGPEWLPAVPIFRWLGVLGLQQIVTSTFGWLYVSQGRTGDFFKNGLMNASITVASFVVGLPWGPEGVAAAYMITGFALRAPIVIRNVGQVGPVGMRDLLKIISPHGAACAVTAGLLVGLAAQLPSPGLLTIFSFGAAGYVVYGLVLTTFPTKRAMMAGNIQRLVGAAAVSRAA